jgi:hypothetical protein
LATSLYLVYSCVELRRRNQRSWQAIVSGLSPAWSAAGSNVVSSGSNKLWTLYRDAGVMMEIADYAQRNGSNLDNRSIEQLRGDAFRMRFNVLKAFVTRSYLP